LTRKRLLRQTFSVSQGDPAPGEVENGSVSPNPHASAPRSNEQTDVGQMKDTYRFHATKSILD